MSHAGIRIADSHCHAWEDWPYQPPVPDSSSRGRVEQLLHEMETTGVDQALVVCAQIDHNPENNAYIARQVSRYPGRLHQLVDLDSEWSPGYHTPGAAGRLGQMAERWDIRGFTHYLHPDDDGSWLTSGEGQALFQEAAGRGLVASLSCYPYQQAAVREAAGRFLTVPVLCHHLGFITRGRDSAEDNLRQVLESAQVPNIYLKVSGFAYAAQLNWEYPYPEVQDLLERLYEAYGARRMCWGSDYPVVRFFMTYRQALEVVRTHCKFISAEDKSWILGGTLRRLLAR